MYVCEWDMCWRNFCNFPLVSKICEKYVKNSPFCNERHFEIWFPKKKTITFSEVNYLNYTKRPNFAGDNYIFPKTRGKRTNSVPIPHPLTYRRLMWCLGFYPLLSRECQYDRVSFKTYDFYGNSGLKLILVVITTS